MRHVIGEDAVQHRATTAITGPPLKNFPQNVILFRGGNKKTFREFCTGYDIVDQDLNMLGARVTETRTWKQREPIAGQSLCRIR